MELDEALRLRFPAKGSLGDTSRVKLTRHPSAFVLGTFLTACGMPNNLGDVVDGGPLDVGRPDTVDVQRMRQGFDVSEVDASTDASRGSDAHTMARSRIEHVIVLAQENHTFDAYFGNYCTAPAGSNPTCTAGPGCCEAVPEHEPSGASPVTLTDDQNGGYDPDHSFDCEFGQINGGRMDRFVTGGDCADPRNFAVAPRTLVSRYHQWAHEGALADRYFQSIVGSTSANDMYFSSARFVFRDNELKPDSVGQGCINPFATATTFDGRVTLADLLLNAGYGFAYYHEGYDRMRMSSTCPLPPSDCRSSLWPLSPCNYDPSDNPFQYFSQFTDNPTYTKDSEDFFQDLNAGRLPSVSFVKFASYHNEHPGYGTYISDGLAQVERVITALRASAYADKTLLLLGWDEGGGYFDHVSPPPSNPIDDEPYGTRVGLIALGPFAKQDYVSHVVMEHSSIVRFIEWNFLGSSGQLQARDTNVNSIADLLDPVAVGVSIP